MHRTFHIKTSNAAILVHDWVRTGGGVLRVTAVLGGSVKLPSRHVFSGFPLFSPIFSSCLPHVKCPLKRLPSLKHLAAFNIASKAADFKLNCTSCSAVTKQTCSALRGVFLGCSGVALTFILEARRCRWCCGSKEAGRRIIHV